MDKKQDKIQKSIKLTNAIKQGTEAFLIISEIEKLENKVDNLPKTDLTKIEDTLNTLTNKLNEEIIYELEII